MAPLKKGASHYR